jgi:hypothetical protein
MAFSRPVNHVNTVKPQQNIQHTNVKTVQRIQKSEESETKSKG